MKGKTSEYLLKSHKYLFILLFTVNCSTFGIKNYAMDRYDDMLDVFSFQISYPFSFGIKMDIGPVAIGGHVSEGSCIGIRGGTFHADGKCHNTTVFFGSGTFNDAMSSGMLIHYDEFWSEREDMFLRRKRYKTGWDFPTNQWGRIGISVGLLLVGFRFEYNMGEDLDLLLGILGLDIFDDDSRRNYLN